MSGPQKDLDPSEKYELDMLVVDTRHVRLVLDKLGGEPAASVVDEEPRLGLSLIRLADVAQVADRVERERNALWRRPPDGDPRRSCTLDRLLADLRTVFERDYAGWVPNFGKNRTMTGIQFVTYPNAEAPTFGSLAAPVPVGVPRAAAIAPAGTADPRRGADVRVGLLDTRLYAHRSLAGRYIAAPGSLLRPSQPRPSGWWRRPPQGTGRSYVEGHAVFLGSLILTEAPAAQLDVRLAVSPQGNSPRWNRAVWDVARQMAEYVSSGVEIMNCSWACYTGDGKPPFVLERALALLTPKIMVVAAAGNHGQHLSKETGDQGQQEDKKYRELNHFPAAYAAAYPAASPNVIAVGALHNGCPAGFNPTVQKRDAKKCGAAAGADLAPWIDMLAPGVDITGAYFGDSHEEDVLVPDPGPDGMDNGRYPAGKPRYRSETFQGAAKWSGTSFAAAILTGAIAARIRPGMTAEEALDELRSGVDSRIRPAHP